MKSSIVSNRERPAGVEILGASVAFHCKRRRCRRMSCLSPRLILSKPVVILTSKPFRQAVGIKAAGGEEKASFCEGFRSLPM